MNDIIEIGCIITVLILSVKALYKNKNIGINFEIPMLFKINLTTEDSAQTKYQNCPYCKQKIKSSRLLNHIQKCPAPKN